MNNVSESGDEDCHNKNNPVLIPHCIKSNILILKFYIAMKWRKRFLEKKKAVKSIENIISNNYLYGYWGGKFFYNDCGILDIQYKY